MRILSIHSRYQIRGGEDEVCDAEKQLLEQQGHTVELYEDFNQRVAELGTVKSAIKTLWSQEAYQQLKTQLKQGQFDLIHVHNFFPLISPSIYYAARSLGIPVVQTLHNYRLLCPSALMFRNQTVCEDCVGKAVPWPGVKYGCYRDSRTASAAVTAMLTLHNQLKTWTQCVDRYIALTEFARQKFIEGGLPADKISVKPNFVDFDPGVGGGTGGYGLFVGRLSPEKGLETLLEAWEKLQIPCPLKIVGDGPLRPLVQQAAQRSPKIEYLGRKPLPEVYDLLGEAIFLVVPSLWYETFGRVVVEAYAKGTPVLVSNLGAIAELVIPEQTGFHFQAGDSSSLAATVDRLLAQPQQLQHLRQQARLQFETNYTAEKNYQQLMEIYQSVCAKGTAYK